MTIFSKTNPRYVKLMAYYYKIYELKSVGVGIIQRFTPAERVFLNVDLFIFRRNPCSVVDASTRFLNLGRSCKMDRGVTPLNLSPRGCSALMSFQSLLPSTQCFDPFKHSQLTPDYVLSCSFVFKSKLSSKIFVFLYSQEINILIVCVNNSSWAFHALTDLFQNYWLRLLLHCCSWLLISNVNSY